MVTFPKPQNRSYIQPLADTTLPPLRPSKRASRCRHRYIPEGPLPWHGRAGGLLCGGVGARESASSSGLHVLSAGLLEENMGAEICWLIAGLQRQKNENLPQHTPAFKRNCLTFWELYLFTFLLRWMRRSIQLSYPSDRYESWSQETVSLDWKQGLALYEGNKIHQLAPLKLTN